MITSAYLSNSPTKLIEGTSTESKAVTVAYFCNTTSSQITVNVYAVPNEASVITNHKIYNQMTVEAFDTLIIDTEKIILGAGDSLWADCSVTNAIISTISSVSI